jgi:hypothetical protein
MRIRSSIFAAALTGLLGVPGRATILFDQTPTNTNGFSITDFRLADDFTLSNSSTITDVLFYYVYSQDGSLSDLGAVTYAIYTNSAGALGTALRSGTIASSSVTRTDQSALSCFCGSAAFSITPLALAAGSYWLELHADTSFTGDNGGLAIDWAAVNDNAHLGALFNASGLTPDTPVNLSGYNQYAFQLDGATVPEPSTLALLGIGLSILAAKARRRSGRVNPGSITDQALANQPRWDRNGCDIPRR